jgi:epoxyqueuosine reductase
MKALARAHGFAFAGISRAERMEPEARRLEAWLNAGNHGQMSYMENHFEMRTDPTKLVPGAKSVVSLLYNYYPDKQQADPRAPKIARYAYGKDYHNVIRKKLKLLLNAMRAEFGEIHGRCFVDSGPVLERDWAKRSGVGWTGKNTLLINPKAGSYFFLAELIVDLELESDAPIRDHCGTCTKCIDACPTDAIADSGYVLDARKCISYLTIELREEIPDEFRGQMENWVFGCDICQEVCPWNRFSEPHQEVQFEPSDTLLNMTANDWHDMTEEFFEDLFIASAVKRTRYSGLKRNLAFLSRSR